MGAVYDIYIAMSHTHILTCVVGRYVHVHVFIIICIVVYLVLV